MRILRLRIDWRDLLPALLIVLNSLVWYTLTYATFRSALSSLSLSSLENLALYGAYFIGIAVSAIFGAWIFPRSRDTCLLIWMLAGTVVTAILPIILTSGMPTNIVVSLLLGVSIGAGLPSCLAYFADVTRVENRGTYGGIIWGSVGFGILLLALLINAFELPVGFTALSVWRFSGFLGFLITKRKRKAETSRASATYDFILRRKDMLLYLVPWIMFSLVNFTEAPILEKLLGNVYATTIFIEFALTGVFGIVGGLLADLVGRKRVVITGFVVIGIGYAVLSFSSGFEASWYVYTALDGAAWGMFAAVFFMTLWGDIAESHEKEKYYVVGGLPYLLAGLLSVVIEPYAKTIGTVTAFSVASFFLFVAVLPLMYAPETLPEKGIRERELREYVEKAKKAKEKYA
jgi:MFS family permease